MPWDAGDAAGHTRKADTPAKQHQWATIADKVLTSSGDDGKAIRIANAAVAKHPSTKKTGLHSITRGRM